NLAAAWSVLRAHAREVQYSEAIDAELAATAEGDYADVRAAALPRPRRRRPEPASARPAAETGGKDGEGSEGGDREGAASPADAGEEEDATAVLASDPAPLDLDPDEIELDPTPPP